MVVDAVDLLAEGRAEPRPQDEHVSTYCGGREEGDEWLDWSDTSLNLYNKIRAITHPGPGARTLLDGQIVSIWHASYHPDWPIYMGTPGQVVGWGRKGVRVKTGDSTLTVEQVQIGDGKEHAPKWRIGTRLGVNLWIRIEAMEVRLAEAHKRIGELEKRLNQV